MVNIKDHKAKILEVQNQLQNPNISWKRKRDLTKYRNRLYKELKLCQHLMAK